MVNMKTLFLLISIGCSVLTADVCKKIPSDCVMGDLEKQIVRAISDHMYTVMDHYCHKVPQKDDILGCAVRREYPKDVKDFPKTTFYEIFEDSTKYQVYTRRVGKLWGFILAKDSIYVKRHFKSNRK